MLTESGTLTNFQQINNYPLTPGDTFTLSNPASFSVFIYGGVNVSGYIKTTPLPR